MNTRERILEESLKLFSRKGFHAVSVREIAGAVGIKDSSLYNHFSCKQEIFSSIVEECCREEEQYFLNHKIPAGPGEDVSAYRELPPGQLEEKVLCTFSYFWESSRNIQFRQLLMLSQFEDEKAGDIYRKIFVEYPMKIQSEVYADLIKAGKFKEEDPNLLAMEFYGPVFLLIHTCKTFEEARPLLLKHLKHFQKKHSREAI